MAEGRMIYSGPMKSLQDYMESIDYDIPSAYNPAEYALSVVSNPFIKDGVDDSTMSEEDSLKRKSIVIAELAEKFRESSYYVPVDMTPTSSKEESFSRAPFYRQLWILCARFLRSTIRDPVILLAEFVQYILFGLFVGLLYMKTTDDQEGVQDRLSALFLLLAALAFIPSLSAVATV
jgi:ATP-binding cassette subfamily G (WHITE) protein 2